MYNFSDNSYLEAHISLSLVSMFITSSYQLCGFTVNLKWLKNCLKMLVFMIICICLFICMHIRFAINNRLTRNKRKIVSANHSSSFIFCNHFIVVRVELHRGPPFTQFISAFSSLGHSTCKLEKTWTSTKGLLLCFCSVRAHKSTLSALLQLHACW